MGMYPEIEEFLKNVKIFANLPGGIKEKIAQKLQIKKYKAGELIYRQGEQSDFLYIIYSGGVEIFVENKDYGTYHVISTLSKYDSLGEEYLLCDELYQNSAIALEDSTIYYLSKSIFNQILNRIPEASLTLCKTLSTRLSNICLKENQLILEDISSLKYDPEIIKLLPKEIMEENKVILLRKEVTHLKVAMVNPKDIQGIKRIKQFIPDARISPVYLLEKDFDIFYKETVLPILEKKVKKDLEFYEKVEIVVRTPSGDEERYLFPKDKKITVGSKKNNNICITDDETISEYHGIFKVINDKVYLKDAGSQYGIYVNGSKIERAVEINQEDTISIGQYKFSIKIKEQEKEEERGYRNPIITEDDSPMGRIIKSFLYPIADFLNDPTISEIMINSWEEIYIEREGKLIRTDRKFDEPAFLDMGLANIAKFVNRIIDKNNPRLDARLPDGSRVHAVIPPCARKGTTIDIRKFTKEKLTVEKLIAYKSITKEVAEFFKFIVLARKNIVVSGGSGSGKTSLLNVLSSFIPNDQRIVVLEDASELQLQQEHTLLLETKGPDKDGKGEVTMRDLLHSALRLRPDRIVVGEVRREEALDMLQAMNTGHSGSMTTVHSNAPRDTLARIETMCLMTGIEIPLRAIREQVASAINIVIHIERFNDGSRKVTNVSEIIGLDGYSNFLIKDIFALKRIGTDDKGVPIVRLFPTGEIPTFYNQAVERGIPPLPKNIFQPNNLEVI